MKTVYVNSTCKYLKIVFSKNHPNNKNIFNQVAMISLQVFGSPLSNYESSLLHQAAVPEEPFNEPTQLGVDFIPRNMKMTSVETSKFDPNIQEKINRLNQEKLQAVAEEDFDTAKHYK